MDWVVRNPHTVVSRFRQGEPSEFVGFGATQRTLSQFVEAGWKLMENYW
jgi:hypothetical protein